jgi:hypothetical protein
MKTTARKENPGNPKQLILSAIGVMLLILGRLCAGTYSGVGSGTADAPYQIATAAHWGELMFTPEDWDKHFILLNDIDLIGKNLTPVGNTTTMWFSGVFDGNGYVIRNATINLPGYEYVALFGYLHFPGKIRNLGVANLAVTGASRVGGLLAFNIGGEVTACYTSGSVIGSQSDVGGLVALNAFGTIQSCYSSAAVQTRVVSGCGSIGGLSGYNVGLIRSCYATGSVTGHGTVGGLVGFNDKGGKIAGCHASGLVTSDYDTGGLVGQNKGTVVTSYATGSVSGKWHAGGFVGWGNQGNVFHCYSTGPVTGYSNVGGFCGYINTGGDYVDFGNFWDTETSLIPAGVSAMGTGKTTAEMMTKLTFTNANWDFVDTWEITENVSYPCLQPTTGSADLNGDGKVDMLDFTLFAQQWLRGT